MTSVVAVCCALFSLGLYGVLSRRELIGVLASIEVMLGSANVLLVGVARAGAADGVAAGVEAVGLVIVVVAAAEAAVGLALLIAAVRRTGRRDVEEFAEVRG